MPHDLRAGEKGKNAVHRPGNCEAIAGVGYIARGHFLKTVNHRNRESPTAHLLPLSILAWPELCVCRSGPHPAFRGPVT